MSEETVEMVERVAPSVARVYVDDPSQEADFGDIHGSGFLIGEDSGGRGLVVTNAHVVSVAPGARHALGFGVRGEIELDVELAGWHPWADIAVLRASIDLKPTPLPFRKEQSRMGEDCLVLGFPWRVDLSVSKGIVSGLDRDSELGPARFPLPWLQSDVVINSGNSGGPMIDLKGRVIGVAAASLAALLQEDVLHQERGAEKIARKVAATGINLFVPSDLAEAAVEGILNADDEGVPVGNEGIEFDRRFWSSFLGRPNIPALRERPGVVVVGLQEGSPAQLAGVQIEDSILRINDLEVDHPADLFAWRIKKESWTQESKFVIWRDGEELEFNVRADQSRVDPTEYEYRLGEAG